jgi:GntP family gluconate:H+ symporter
LIDPVTTMQIYFGAIPFVLIQIVMVGLIIAFPAIVSSGLDKTEKIDLNSVQLEVQPEPAAPEPALQADGTPAPPASNDGKAADDDPMKAMQDAIDKENKK